MNQRKTAIALALFSATGILASCASMSPITGPRPVMTPEQAAQFTQAAVLNTAKLDSTTPATIQDKWDPEADAFMAGKASVKADYIVDAGKTADGKSVFTSVQAAVNFAALDAAASKRTQRIYIQLAPGTYKETVFVPASSAPITLYSNETDARKTVISFDIDAGMPGAEYTKKLNPEGKIYSKDAKITDAGIYGWFNSCASKSGSVGTGCTTVMWVKNNGFQMKNITVENAYNEGRGKDGKPGQSTGNHQAVALETDGADKVHLENVRLLGNQDTLYIKSANPSNPDAQPPVYATIGRNFINNSYVEGDVDFIFGRGTALFKHSEIRYLGARNSPEGYIGAPSTDRDIPYGFVFINCNFTNDGKGERVLAGKISLGRQWFESIKCSPYSTEHGYTCTKATKDAADSKTKVGTYSEAVMRRVGKMVVINSQIGSHINKTQPWSDWGDKTSSAYRPAQYSDPSGKDIWLGEYNNK